MTKSAVRASTVIVLVAAWIAALAATETFADASVSVGVDARRSIAAVSLPKVAAVANYQGLWWNPAESGWGINFAHQGDTVFASWFTYDVDGSPLWMVMAATKTAANVYEGTLYRAVGPPFYAIPFDPAKVVGTAVGPGKVTFADETNATFDYTIGGVTQTKQLTRQVFAAPVPSCSWSAQADLAGATNYQDLWWKEPAGSESGWGINLTHQGATIFATWYTYDGFGKPWWVTAAATRVAPGTYRGKVYTAQSGPPYNATPFDPAKVKPLEVGTVTFTFADGAHGMLDATILDTRIRRPITRQSFGAPGSGTVCTPTEVITACQVSVTSGFGGDLNATYDTGSGSSGGGAGAGAGGAGAGAGEGKVLGGLMTLTRLSDGAALGAAVTDSQNGLVTIKSCEADWPALLTLAGQPGARYYDEGTNQFGDFGPGRMLHALVDQFDENVGVSPLTEAAYLYALNNIAGNPADVVAGTASLKLAGSVIGLTTAQVRQANAAVLNEINRTLPVDSQLATLKSLPTPVDSASPNTAYPNNRYGIAASVTGGLAKLSANYLASPTPGLDGGAQLARDLTDGKLNGFALGETPAAAGSSLHYDAVRFPVALTTAMYDVSARFGTTSTLTLGNGISDLRVVETFTGFPDRCFTQIDQVALLKDGTVNVRRIVPVAGKACFRDPADSTATLIRNFATNVKQIATTNTNGYLVKTDGSVWAWGSGQCGLLGNGQASGSASAPVRVSGLTDVTSLAAAGSYTTIARDSRGYVYSWGSDFLGLLGTGGVADTYACHVVAYATGSNLVPRRIPTLANIVGVSSGGATNAFAIDDHGNVYRWGASNLIQEINTPIPVPGLSSIVSMAGMVAYKGGQFVAVTAALDANGTVFEVDFVNAPRPVPGLTDVVELAGYLVLQRDGTVRALGSADAVPLPSPIRHVEQPGGWLSGTYGYGTDNVVREFTFDASGSIVVTTVPTSALQ